MPAVESRRQQPERTPATMACATRANASGCVARDSNPSLSPRSERRPTESRVWQCEEGFYCTEGSSAGLPCLAGTKGEGSGLREVGECTSCTVPTHSAPGSATCEHCIATFYKVPGVSASASPNELCAPCPAGTTCRYNATNASSVPTSFTLANIVLERHRWRMGHAAKTVSHCIESTEGVSACLGGDDPGIDGEGYCVAGHYGPRCQLCSNASLYFDEDLGTCKDCPKAGDMFLIGVIAAGALLAVAALYGILQLHSCRCALTWGRRLYLTAGSHALVPKLKLLCAAPRRRPQHVTHRVRWYSPRVHSHRAQHCLLPERHGHPTRVRRGKQGANARAEQTRA